MKKKNLIYILTFFLSLFFITCSKVPITGRKQIHLLPSSVMLNLSFDNYSTFLSKNNVVSNNANANVQMVKRVGEKLEKATISFMDSHNYKKVIKNFKWEFHLVKSNEVNAWCMPGGKIVVYTGILPIVKNDTGLAVVLGHEIGHAIARHGNERMSVQLLDQLGEKSLEVALQENPKETNNIFLTAVGVGSQLGLMAYSRMQESEADKIGLVLMAKAGYDPRYALKFWKDMNAQSGGSNTPTFLSDHPSNDKRIADIKAFLPTALQYYYNKNK